MNDTQLSKLLMLRKTDTYKGGAHRWDDLFGLEFELEEIASPLRDETGYWISHRDGSLIDGIEYVLARPRGGELLQTALDAFYNGTLRAGGGLRTSTHIHINAVDMTVDQLRSMMVIMYVIEDDLFRYIGENRKWAGYAMGLAEMEPKRLSALLSDNNPERLVRALSANRSAERYYGLNVSSVTKHGSVEFRYYPGMPTRPEVESWLDLALAVKRAAVARPVEDLVRSITNEAELNTFLRDILPGTIRDALLSTNTALDRWRAFCSVAALTEQGDGFNRQDRLVRVTPELVKVLVQNKLVKPEGGEYLRKRGSELRIMTIRDYQILFNEATGKNNRVTKKATIFRDPEDYDEDDEDEDRDVRWVQAEPQLEEANLNFQYRPVIDRVPEMPEAPVPAPTRQAVRQAELDQAREYMQRYLERQREMQARQQARFRRPPAEAVAPPADFWQAYDNQVSTATTPTVARRNR